MIIIISSIITGIWLAAILSLRRSILTFWHEPVFRHPVLIIESDDWGPGPDNDAIHLHRIIDLLVRFQDHGGRYPKFTLGVLLSLPDSEAVKADSFKSYHRLMLWDERFIRIRRALERGSASGVFSFSLHGMEHFWPQALLNAAKSSVCIREWLTGELPDSSELPPHLQTRWADASNLPSIPVPVKDITGSIRDEVRAFKRLFGFAPSIAVAPTFIWTRDVERAWSDQGIKIIITPGRRNEKRDSSGRPASLMKNILNGDRASDGALYMVRNHYFEPALGHRASQVIGYLKADMLAGRPTILETHRFNFTKNTKANEFTFLQLSLLYKEVLIKFPDILFISTEELADSIENKDIDIIEHDRIRRFNACLFRVCSNIENRKILALTGLIVPVLLVHRAIRFWLYFNET